MNRKTNNLLRFCCFVFVVDSATCEGPYWVEDLRMEGSYDIGNCNATVTCYVQATRTGYSISFQCIGYSSGNGGFHYGEIERYDFDKIRQTISITECYDELKFTCSSGSTSKSLTLSLKSGPYWVEDLRMEGSYEIGNCNATVTCYVQATRTGYSISFQCIGYSDNGGFHYGEIERYDFDKIRQTISITKCYDELKFTCSSGSTSKSLTLSLKSAGVISVGVVVGVVIAVIFILCIIAGGIGLLIRRRTHATVVGSGYPVVQINPSPGTHPAQPQPMVYSTTLQSMPSPSYPQAK